MNFQTLESVREYLDDIPCINSGGCTVSMLAMYRWLKLQGEKSDMMYLYRNGSTYLFSTNEACLNGELDSPNSCSHAMLFYNGKYIDSEEEFNTLPEKYPKSHILPEHLVVASLNYDVWNDAFNRRWIRIIEEKLNINLSDILITPIW